MPHPDGAHTHGPGGPGTGWLILGLAALAVAAGGGLSAAESGLMSLLWAVVAVMLVAGVALGVVMVRQVRSRTGDYVRSIHGPTERDRLIDEQAVLRREIARIRATRLEIERFRAYYGALGPGWMHEEPAMRPDYTRQGTVAGRIEPDPGHE